MTHLNVSAFAWGCHCVAGGWDSQVRPLSGNVHDYVTELGAKGALAIQEGWQNSADVSHHYFQHCFRRVGAHDVHHYHHLGLRWCHRGHGCCPALLRGVRTS